MATVRVWFKLEGAASADFVKLSDLPPEPIIGDLRDAIYAKNKAKLEPQRVVSADLRLSSTDGKSNYDEETLVSTIAPAHATKATGLLVTSACLLCGSPHSLPLQSSARLSINNPACSQWTSAPVRAAFSTS